VNARPCAAHLVIDCPDCPAAPDDDIQPLHQWRPAPAPAAAAPEQLVCPECGGTEFELFLGGRRSGQVACAGCGLMFDRPDAGSTS
jgi:hypothetical protein